ncbi:MAG: EAL domain-containing protein [Pseudazoarcus pumilus]|nr:EAL domain-containing protein [Pseudazoarcus pumilus]
MLATFRLQLGIAALYGLAGWLSLQILVPTGYVAPVYPPAGIALGAMLLYGYRVWPGVLVGALLTNAVATLYSGQDPGPTIVISGAGAALQAAAGAWLARRLISFPNPLDSPRSIARLLFIVAPVSSLINSSLSTPALLYAGIITTDNVLSSWGSWWLGDTLGALVALPLMFVFLARPAELWRPRRLAVAVPLVIVALLTAVVFDRLDRAESQRIKNQFDRDAENIATLIEKRLQAQTDALNALERFIALSEDVSRGEFRGFTAALLERHPGTQNFSWNPLIRHAERAEFERLARAEGLPGFSILERDNTSPSRTAVAGPRDDYLPIHFVEPQERNTGVLGFDPLSMSNTAAAIASTREHGRPTASDAFTLTQERGQQRGVVVYQSVRRPTPDGEQFIGIVSVAFRMDDALAATVVDLPERQVALCLVDRAGTAGNTRLSGPAGCEDTGWLDAPLARSFDLSFGERPWQIRLLAEAGYADNLRTLTPWLSIVTGILAAGILAAFLLMTSGHARRVERMVEQRTRELADASDDLRAQRAALNRAQEIARMGSWEIDTASGALRCSEGLRTLLPLPPGDALRYDDLLAAIEPADRPRLDRAVSAMRNGGSSITLDCHPEGAHSTTLQFVIDIENLGADHERVVGTAQDVSGARKAAADIQQLAHYDSLTGLPNRMLWTLRATAALQVARRHNDALAVLFLDLDHFKTVNDSLGHNAGDTLLKTVATRLTHCAREEDLLARLGGDEFVVLLPRLSRREDATLVAQKMLDSMSEPVELGGHVLQPSLSIGIAHFPEDGPDVETLLKHADTAMYGAKSAGRSTIRHFVESMNARALERLTIENGLRRAIERDELSLHFQPQYDAVAERFVGVEALLRWHSPELGGLIPPDRFIPIAEETGIILALGDWVLEQACTLQRRWQQSPKAELLVAVNISAIQFNHPDFVGRVARILQRTAADPRRIELEITETAIMGSGDEVLARLHQLRDLGLTLALDDFGTGYSSLGRLHRLPITRLKLDRSFVQYLPGDLDNAAIANATLSMARALKLEVVAEGIETVAQKAYLFARGCRLMQGYLYSVPLPLDELENFLAADAQRNPPQA